MDKRGWIQILKIRYGDFELTSKSPSTPWSKWKKLSHLSPAELVSFNLRQVFEDEIVLDLEDPGQLEGVEKKLQEENFSYTVWKTGSRGYHISLFFSELKSMNPEQRKETKKQFIESYGADTSKHAEHNVIALEFAPHFKTGKIKELVSGELDFKDNKLPGNKKTKELELESILKKIDAPIVNYCTSHKMSNGDRNNVLFKNLAALFIHKELSEDEIKYLVNIIVQNCPGKTENEFIGWLEKARKGIIKEYNEKEMLRWAEKNNISVIPAAPTKKIEYSSEEKSEAEKVAKEGSPLLFLVETIAKFHSREKDAILLLLLSGLSSGFADRSKTIHVMAVGSSGKGKTAVMDSTSKVFTRVQRITSSSSKSQFYKSYYGMMIHKGILIFDEAENSKEGQALERVYTDGAEENPTHETVSKEGFFQGMEIKEINVVWRNSINTPEDDEGQLCNRYNMFNVDESEVQDYLVYQHQLNKIAFGGNRKKDDSSIKIAKALTDIITSESIEVFIPFAELITLSKITNRRTLPKFLSFIKCVTYAARFQREKLGSVYISYIEDYEIAKMVWDKINRMESLHIRQKDQMILAVLSSREWMSVDDISENPDISKEMSRATIVRALKNMKEKGLVDCKKVDGLNKYEWQAFQHISQVVINFSKEEFTPDAFESSINHLLKNFDEITCQEIRNSLSKERIDEFYQKIVAHSVTVDKLKSMLQEDQRTGLLIEENLEKKRPEESVKSPEEPRVEEEWILNDEESRLYAYLQNYLEADEEEVRIKFGNKLVDRLLKIGQIFSPRPGKLRAT